MTAGPTKSRETFLQELDRLFRQHHELMYQVALRVTRNHHDAEDVLQKIFMRLMQSVIQGAPPPSDFVKNPPGYLHRAAINEATSRLRWRERQKPMNVSIDSQEIAVAGPDAEPDERIVRLRAALAKMKPSLIEVLILYYIEEYKCSDIAEMTGRAVGTVWAQLCRARIKLIQLIRNQEKYCETKETKHQRSSGSVLADGSQA